MSRRHRALGLAAITLGLAAAFADLRPIVDAKAVGVEQDRGAVSAPDVAERLVRGESLFVFDLRPRADYEQLHVASARSASPDDLARESFPPDAAIVVYADDDARVARALSLLRARGYHNVFFLRDGVYEWIGRVLEPRLAVDATAAERAEFGRAAGLSRFFGGLPRADVPRAEVPVGYWTGAPQLRGHSPVAVRQAIARIRRRGC